MENAQVHDQIHNHRLIVARKSIEQKFHSIIYFYFFSIRSPKSLDPITAKEWREKKVVLGLVRKK